MSPLLWVAAAWACPVCGAAMTSNQSSYFHMTILLSLVPLTMAGGLIYWLNKAAASAEPPAPETDAGPTSAG